MKTLALSACVLMVSLGHAGANSARANAAACNDLEMRPRHAKKGQFITDNVGKFEITLSAAEYDPLNSKSSISVQLASSIETQFRGFLIQARRANSYDRIAKGVMRGPDELSGQLCGVNGNGMTHTSTFSNSWKYEISLSWKPPSDVCEATAMGDLWFQATVVKLYTDAPHINIFSRVLKMKNVTDPSIILGCIDRNGSTTALLASSVFICMLLTKFIF